MSNPNSWSNAPNMTNAAGASGTMSSGNPTFTVTEQGLGKGGVYKIFVTRSGLFGGKLAKQDPKAASAAASHFGLIGWIIAARLAKKAAAQIAEKEATYNSIGPDDSRFLGVDADNFRIEPASVASIEIKSKLGVLGWGSDYDCSFVVHLTDGKKRTFFVKKGVGGQALQNLLRGLTMNILMK